MNNTIAVEPFDFQLGGGLHLKGEVRAKIDGEEKPVLILAHGFRGHRQWGFWPDVAERFALQGYYAVSFDFSRIAAIKERLDEHVAAKSHTISQEIEDLSSIVASVLDEQLPLASEANRDRLALLGHSRAGGSSIILASEQPAVSAVVVWNGGGGPPLPAAEDQLTRIEREIVEDLYRNASRLDVLRAYAELDIPALIIQGSADSERLLKRNQELKSARPDQTYIHIEQADHTFGAVHPYKGSTAALDLAVYQTLQFLQHVLKTEIHLDHLE
jgi:dienelactone hydrolase